MRTRMGEVGSYKPMDRNRFFRSKTTAKSPGAPSPSTSEMDVS
jgi:hypothetical protein